MIMAKKKKKRTGYYRRMKPYELRAKLECDLDKYNANKSPMNASIEMKNKIVFSLDDDNSIGDGFCRHPGCNAKATINGYCDYHNRYQNAESK